MSAGASADPAGLTARARPEARPRNARGEPPDRHLSECEQKVAGRAILACAIRSGDSMSTAWIPALTTAVVGIAGLITTWAAAHRQTETDLVKFREEHQHQIVTTRRQERIQLYPQFLKAGNDALKQVIIASVTLPPGKGYKSSVFWETQKLISEVEVLTYQISLIASDNVGKLSQQVVLELQKAWSEVIRSRVADETLDEGCLDPAPKLFGKLMKSMAEELRARD